jgi:hypothetical protein
MEMLEIADKSWGFTNPASHSFSEGERMKEFIAWFISSTPARSLNWKYRTDIIAHIPAA